MEVGEAGTRRLSLRAVGGATKEQEEEEVKSREEGGDSEQVTTETDGEEGILNAPERFELP